MSTAPERVEGSVEKTDSSPESVWEASVCAHVSLWVDGEAEDDPSVLATAEGRQAWATYHLIGDALRSTELVVYPSAGFQARLERAIEAEPAIVAPPVMPVGRSVRLASQRRWRLGLSGLAVAAAVAAVAWMAQPYLGLGTTTTQQADATSVANDAGAATIDETGLRDYLEAHRQMAGPSAVRPASFDVGATR